MKILVTGHKGFIGQNLIEYLREYTNWEVSGWEWELNKYPKINGNDWVIHLGAISSTVEQDLDKIMTQNVEFSQWLYNECKRYNVNLQFSSSASIYGLSLDFSETAKPQPLNYYAYSKYLFERWLSKQPTSNLIIQGFRYFNVYGNYEEHKGSQASPVTQFTKQAFIGEIKLFENSDKYFRDFIAVQDICRIHVEFIKTVTQSGIWNIGTGNTNSFQHIADLISEKYNAPIKYIKMPEILVRSYQTYTCADITKLENTIGQQTWISVENWLNNFQKVLD
jgi:ADP-L-glycero-D-manno-heptose 6-epimerase